MNWVADLPRSGETSIGKEFHRVCEVPGIPTILEPGSMGDKTTTLRPGDERSTAHSRPTNIPQATHPGEVWYNIELPSCLRRGELLHVAPTRELHGLEVVPSTNVGEAFLLFRYDVPDEPVEQSLAVNRRGVRGRGARPFDVIGQASLGGLPWRHVPLPFRRSC